MALTITNFTADADSMVITIQSTTALTTSILFLTDDSVVNIFSDFNATANPDEYQATISEDYSDGIFTLDISNTGDNLIISIGNLLIGYQYLLSQTIKEEWDCILLQQLQGVEQLLLANEGDLARNIYLSIQNKAASCTDAPMLDYHIAKTNIWIEEGKFIIT